MADFPRQLHELVERFERNIAEVMFASGQNIMSSSIRPIDFADPNDSARHENMVSLVDRMQELNKRWAVESSPNDKVQIEREIELTDRQIDRLVYELYGLSDEEIKIVEEATTI